MSAPGKMCEEGWLIGVGGGWILYGSFVESGSMTGIAGIGVVCVYFYYFVLIWTLGFVRLSFLRRWVSNFAHVN